MQAFAYTYAVQEVDQAGKRRQAATPHVPFVLWPIQRELALALEHAIDDGHDLLIDKAREMGASWCCLTVIHHQWLFRPGRLFLEMSRVETDVDDAKNPRTLFAKHDYLNSWLPGWMRPNITRTRLHLVNEDNGSRIDGESTNKAAGSADRRHAILLDEFSKVEHGDRIRTSTADVAPCRIVNATQWGAGTAYNRWRESGQIKVFELPWHEHPSKGRGRYTHLNDQTGKWSIRSPWYDAECKKRSPKEIAQELDRDPLLSGSVFFDPATVEAHRKRHARLPRHRMTIDFQAEVSLAQAAKAIGQRQHGLVKPKVDPKGPLSIWAELIAGRPDQTRNYVIGCDISKGQGASNSVASIYCCETGEKIGEWANAQTPPHDFARIVCAMALWIGGASNGGRPVVIWEANGDPGWSFGREIVRVFRYPRCYFDRAVNVAHVKRGKRYGFYSNSDKKGLLLRLLEKAYAQGGFINHSALALDEALTYTVLPDGGIAPASLTEESPAARKTHGDRVVADALCLWAATENPASAAVSHPSVPGHSIGARREAALKRRTAQGMGRSFDFAA